MYDAVNALNDAVETSDPVLMPALVAYDAEVAVDELTAYEDETAYEALVTVPA